MRKDIEAGRAYVELLIKDKRFKNGLAQARRIMGGAARAMSMAAAAGVAATAAIWAKVAPAIDEAAKAADRLNIAMEALTGLAHAANISGSNMTELTKALTLMSKNVGDAMSGTGDAADELERLGLNAVELSKLSADRMFIEIAEAIGALGTASEKTNAGMQIFGRSGANLMPLMSEGSKGVRALMEDAEALGLTFNRADAAIVEMANDANTRFKAAIQGIMQQFVIGLAPAVKVSTDEMTKLLGTFTGKNSGEEFADKIRIAFGGAADALAEVYAFFLKSQAGLLKLLSTAVEAKARFSMMSMENVASNPTLALAIALAGKKEGAQAAYRTELPH